MNVEEMSDDEVSEINVDESPAGQQNKFFAISDEYVEVFILHCAYDAYRKK